MTSLETPRCYTETPDVLPLVGFEDIQRTLTYLQLPFEDYFVIGGASLVLRGVKPRTSDLDMLVSNETFDWLSAVPGAVMKDPPARAVERGAGNQTVWIKSSQTPIPISATTELGDGYYPMSFESHKDQVELVSGIPCIPLNYVIEAKKALQRPKDIVDLEVIAHFLGKTIDLPQPSLEAPYLDS